jgi:hypothetical protein
MPKRLIPHYSGLCPKGDKMTFREIGGENQEEPGEILLCERLLPGVSFPDHS